MAIVINLDKVMKAKNKSLNALSEDVGITIANLSILKNQKAKAIKFSTLEKICISLECTPGDIIEYKHDEEEKAID